MTDKAQKILQKINKRQALKRLANPERRDRILDEFNRENMGDVGPVGGQEGMNILQEMNDLGQRQEQIIREAVPKMTVY